jgi:predicted FMN-binding regulatory protein PaiB
MTDAADTRGVLDALVQRFEGGRAAPWTLRMPERQRDAMVAAIVAFRLRITRLEGKFKLSQNRSAKDRARVAAALKTEGYADATSTADWMERYAMPAAAPAQDGGPLGGKDTAGVLGGNMPSADRDQTR